MKKIIEIPATVAKQSKNTDKQYRVAAYCRVSTDKEEQENSLENQITYYKNKIESTPNWMLVDIFADFGISGVSSKNRPEFQRMMNLCDKGKIDLIITKSISRFARNTVDCLSCVRSLKAKNIGIIFEKEGINTLDTVSETFLTWFSAFAQAESESLSQNVTRGKRMGYKEGKFAFPAFVYGYVKESDGTPSIFPKQAEIIRKMFHMYLEGESIRGIKKWLKEHEIESPTGTKEWGESTISGILKNEKYKGDVLLQKSYTVDYLTKTTVKNKGEVTQYYIENNHEGIVSRKVFDMVQKELQRRSSLYSSKIPGRYSSKYALTGKVVCSECGAKYRRVTRTKYRGEKKIVWRCIERLINGTKNCKHSPTISEEDLHKAIIDNLKQLLSGTDEIAQMIKNEIEIVLYKNDYANPRVIRRKMQNLEKEAAILKNILRETDDKAFYTKKIRNIEEELSELKSKQENALKENKNAVLLRIQEVIDNTELNMHDYFNQIVRATIEFVTVINEEMIKIRYVDGTEVKEKI